MDTRATYDMANRLLQQHGLTGWTVVFDRAKSRAGVCRFGRQQIGLSAPLTRLHSDAEVRDTILHEIAHALVGPQHGHNAVWKEAARAIGCSANRCLPKDAPVVAGSWEGVCPRGHTSTRHRRPTRVASCPRCAPAFDPEFIYDWTYHGRKVDMHPNFLTELEALMSGNRGPRAEHLLRLGDRARVLEVSATGRYGGRIGTIVKRGRSRFHLQIHDRILTVPFALVGPVGPHPE